MSDAENSAQPEAEAQRRPRKRQLVRAQMVDSFHDTRDILIRNVSENGIGATCRSCPPAVGEVLCLMLPEDIFAQGTVRWVVDQAFGVELHETLDVERITRALQRRMRQSAGDTSWQVQPAHQISEPLQRGQVRRV